MSGLDEGLPIRETCLQPDGEAKPTNIERPTSPRPSARVDVEARKRKGSDSDELHPGAPGPHDPRGPALAFDRLLRKQPVNTRRILIVTGYSTQFSHQPPRRPITR